MEQSISTKVIIWFRNHLYKLSSYFASQITQKMFPEILMQGRCIFMSASLTGIVQVLSWKKVNYKQPFETTDF